MMTLIEGGEVYAPEYLGRKDILCAGGTIAAISEPGTIRIQGLEPEIINASGKFVVPAFIDSHVHILGGGGEGGPATRAPEIRMEDIIASGVATVIGCLGTDGITRSMESLLAKANGLEAEGIHTYIFSGSYEIPVMTLTRNVRTDLILITKVIGAGEIALSDHRSSQPTFEDFARLAAECRVGGMLGGKAGILHCHIGSGEKKLSLIHRLIDETEIPPTQVIPTHVNRNTALLEDAARFIRKGGASDLTAGADPASDEGHLSIASSISFFRNQKIPIDHITISSDSNGSLPVFNEKGVLTGLTIATEKSLLANFRYLVRENILPLDKALKPFSTNPAGFYKFKKGEIRKGYDADILLLDNDYNLSDSIIAGRVMMKNGDLVVRGTFSTGS